MSLPFFSAWLLTLKSWTRKICNSIPSLQMQVSCMKFCPDGLSSMRGTLVITFIVEDEVINQLNTQPTINYAQNTINCAVLIEQAGPLQGPALWLMIEQGKSCSSHTCFPVSQLLCCKDFTGFRASLNSTQTCLGFRLDLQVIAPVNYFWL